MPVCVQLSTHLQGTAILRIVRHGEPVSAARLIRVTRISAGIISLKLTTPAYQT